jgi:hypothetical protein
MMISSPVCKSFNLTTHVGVDASSGIVHTVGLTSGNVHDAKVMDHLIRDVLFASAHSRVAAGMKCA